jgi:hypothetical protein
MDIMDSWSVELARVAAPDEIDLAPAMTQAYLTGGKSRQEMYTRASGSQPGAFGMVEGGAIFPYLLKGIAAAAPTLSAMLASAPLVNDLVSAIKEVINIREAIKKAKKPENPAENPYAPLKRALDSISKELEAAQLPQEQREIIAFRVLSAFLEKPAGAAQFVQKLESAPK